MRPKDKVIRIRRSLVVYFDKALRPALDDLARQSGLRRRGGPPCDAELARVLIIAQLLDGMSDAAITAAAIHSNAVIALGRRLATLGHDLVPDLYLQVADLPNVGEPPLAPPKPRRARAGDQGGRPRVCLVLDQWTHARLVAYASQNPAAYDGQSILTEEGKTRPCADDMALVRGLLEAALRHWKRLLPIVVKYVRLMRHIESSISATISAEQKVITSALSKALVGHSPDIRDS